MAVVSGIYFFLCWFFYHFKISIHGIKFKVILFYVQNALNENGEVENFTFIGEYSFAVEAINTVGRNHYNGFDSDTPENDEILQNMRREVIKVLHCFTL